MSWDDLQFGTVPEWVAAIGGLLAAVFAGWLLRKQTEATKHLLDQDHRRQAEQVALRYTWQESEGSIPNGPMSETIQVEVLNDSPRVVRSFVLSIRVGEGVPSGPGETWRVFPLLFPGEKQSFRSTHEGPAPRKPTDLIRELPSFVHGVSALFQDADGTCWKITEDHELRESDGATLSAALVPPPDG